MSKEDINASIYQSFLDLGSKKPLSMISYAEIGNQLKIEEIEIRKLYVSPMEIVDEIMNKLHQDLLGQFIPDKDETVKGNLFDLVMNYFEALQEHRFFFLNLERFLSCRPHLLCQRQAQIHKLFLRMLLQCDLRLGKIEGAVKARVLQGVFWSVYKTWRKEDSTDLPKTMAALDKNLTKIERWETQRQSFCRRTGRA